MAGGLAGAALLTSACTAPPEGPDLAVSFNGSFVHQSVGSVQWESVGTEAVTGPTTVTLTVLSGPLRFTGLSQYGADPNYELIDWSVAPDGLTMTARFDGSLAVGSEKFAKTYGTGWAEGSTGTLRAIVQNAGDVSPLNDTVEITYVAQGPFPPTTAATPAGA